MTAKPGAALVVAGAGTGKTRAITYRVAYLIEQGVSPQRILLATFTNRAAREMLRRVEALTSAQNVHRVWGGTFHRIANLILRRHAVSIGFDSNYSILDTEDAKDFLNVCIDEAGIDTKREPLSESRSHAGHHQLRQQYRPADRRRDRAALSVFRAAGANRSSASI